MHYTDVCIYHTKLLLELYLYEADTFISNYMVYLINIRIKCMFLEIYFVLASWTMVNNLEFTIDINCQNIDSYSDVPHICHVGFNINPSNAFVM